MNEAERCSDDDDDADATACAMHVDNAIDGQSDDDGEDIMSMRGCNDDDRDDEDDDDDADDGNESEEADDAEAISVCQSCNSVGHKTRSHFKCPKHVCTKCHTEGHNKKQLPASTMSVLRPFRPRNEERLQIPPLRRRGSRLVEHFPPSECTAQHQIVFRQKKDCTVNPTNLRVDGKFREFTDWGQMQRNCAVTDEQLLQLKNAANDFKRDRNRAYKTTERNLNKRTEAPLNFAFKRDYDHESVAKCVHCHTWLFWPEKSQKEW